jgi:hypothetical protein
VLLAAFGDSYSRRNVCGAARFLNVSLSASLIVASAVVDRFRPFLEGIYSFFIYIASAVGCSTV